MIGFQPTLPMPPLSTIYGLISAAAGRVVGPCDTFVGYTFRSYGKAVDLERILEVQPGRGGKRNIINREILLDNTLDLYIDLSFESYFKSPHYPLLLGRSSDLACVDHVERVELEEVSSSETSTFGESIYIDPPKGFRVASMYSLPVSFTDSIPRESVGTRAFIMVSERYEGRGAGYRTPDTGLTIQIFSEKTLGL